MVGGDSGGGSRQLAELIDEHGETLHFDFLNYTPFLLRQIVDDHPPMSPREVISWIRNLPPESAFMASLRGGPDHRGWDVKTHLLANIFDAVQANTFVLVSANSKKKPKPPKPIDRPKAKQEKKKPGANRFAAMARSARRQAVKQANLLRGKE